MVSSKEKNNKVTSKPMRSPIWSVEGVMFDAELIPHLSKAENGNCDSARMLAESFLYGHDETVLRVYRSGIRVKPNTDIARYYSQIALELHEKEKVNSPNSYAVDLGIRAIIEAQSGHYEVSKKYYLKAIKQLFNNVPPEQWDFGIFINFRFTMLNFGIIHPEQYEF